MTNIEMPEPWKILEELTLAEPVGIDLSKNGATQLRNALYIMQDMAKELNNYQDHVREAFSSDFESPALKKFKEWGARGGKGEVE